MTTKKQTINDKVTKIDKLIEHFEKEDKELDIDNDLNKYEEAMKLVNEVQKELEDVELRIKEIKEKYN